MAQRIIHVTENGNVAVTTPVEGFDINEVLVKDCPDHAIIVDSSELPQGDDAKFFDAWELVDGKVIVNFTKAKAIRLEEFNANALLVAQARQLNNLSGIPNAQSDADFLDSLNTGRSAIDAATTTSELLAIVSPK